MTTITINTYDVAGRFDMTKEEARKCFQHVETLAIDANYNVDYTESLYTDEESERFVEKAFQSYYPE
ncbi:hypothetical protein AB204_02470 [Xenorhabdus khoisanae]|uniref:Uncharacterized protein n=1 Tax=Xenorhabdus khoisanae TaxID=880157 RepID=A0A0J5IU53_9GAMM|nr:hypothetical protein [Xenorhabdus khoisanae]KMJ46700.1 hypothetical protein AB204_02470 [Xenorhabdus khoisanae]